ncbi:MAG: DUF4491 family protein [Fibromonadales bacterium]|nr:DUF4491 family protein [Fibromonadales bacterium]
MDFSGIIVGFGTFLIIGILHPVVIKGHYYFGTKCWPVFALLGVASCATSLLTGNLVISILLAVLGFSLFWTIHELFEQEKRVKKGWFPANPKSVSKAANS